MNFGRVVKIISDILFVTGLVIAGLFLVSHFTGYKPFQVFIVSSGSMEPAIKTGSAVVIIPQSSYAVGDIISFYGNTKKTTTTHRIVGVGDGSFRIAGDANDQPDPGLVPTDKVIGTVRLSIPYVGYLAAFAKTPRGFILLVIVPATIIIYEELKGLFLEIKRVISRIAGARKGRQTGAQREAGNDQAGEHLQLPALEGREVAEAQSEPPRKFFLKPAIILPAFFACLISFSLSYSYFIDTETSSGNVFGASAPTPTSTPPVTPTPTPGNGPTPTPTPLPIATTLVMNEILPDPSCIQGQTPGQFVELWNGTAGTVNLKDYQLSDGTNTIAISNSNTNLASHAFAILVKSEGVIIQCLGDVHGATTVNLGGQIDLNTGSIQLLDAVSSVVDTVLWGSSPNPTPTQDQSIERSPTGLDTALGTNFAPSDFVILSTVTPGQ